MQGYGDVVLCVEHRLGLGCHVWMGWPPDYDVGRRGISHAAHYGTWPRESYCRGERDANLKGKIT